MYRRLIARLAASREDTTNRQGNRMINGASRRRHRHVDRCAIVTLLARNAAACIRLRNTLERGAISGSCLILKQILCVTYSPREVAMQRDNTGVYWIQFQGAQNLDRSDGIKDRVAKPSIPFLHIYMFFYLIYRLWHT